MSLIEKLGLEKCQAIVSDAPEWAKYWITRGEYHGHIISFPNMTGHSSYLLNDLRTAIADHNQNLSEQRARFEKAYSLKVPESKVTLLPNGNYSGWIKQKKWKDWQAKQEQLQSKLNNCSAKDSSEISITDHCTDIRNHISPLTGVIER